MNTHTPLSVRWLAITLAAALLLVGIAALLAGALLWPGRAQAQAQALGQINIPGLAGSAEFGKTVTTLPNGNFVVTDSTYSEGSNGGVGAVYLYDGATLELISVLKGSSTEDHVGNAGVTVLANGNFVVASPGWSTWTGAVTWGSATNGFGGPAVVVSPANSLTGSNPYEQVGTSVAALTNGNYVVGSPTWRNGGQAEAGAVTWGDGANGTTGAVAASNSLVGAAEFDTIGSGGITVLANGNYVVNSPGWHDLPDVRGAVTWADGSAALVGTVSELNSLIATQSLYGDSGTTSVTALANGNYVVRSPNGYRGAVTWADGSTGLTGTISISNSVIGLGEQQIGDGGITPLANGNYVISSPESAGCLMTWASGTAAVTGALTSDISFNSCGHVTPLTNGNYVVTTQWWDGSYLGAVTWADGTTGITGTISAANSLVGSTYDDQVGGGDVFALTNGNYVVASPYWDNGAVYDAGAVTWADGTTGITGTVSTANSLVGSSQYERLGHEGVAVLTNGNYVVSNPYWPNGGATAAGAVTWGDGTTGITGTVSADNSIVGSSSFDEVGVVTALINGNYVVGSRNWTNGDIANAGAATWADGTTATSTVVSTANSLYGDRSAQVGSGAGPLANGDYVVVSPAWSSNIYGVGAITWGDGAAGTVGPVSDLNSVFGKAYGGGVLLNFAYAAAHNRLVVGRPLDNVVTVAAKQGALLSVGFGGNGSGMVAGPVAGIESYEPCAASIIPGFAVTLNAPPNPGSTFAGWAGACNGAGACTVTMDSAQAVTATFTLNSYALTVGTAGSGSGTVSGIPDNPGALLYGTYVMLNAVPANDSTFAGWSGACTNASGPCELTMDGPKAVTATFTLKTHALEVTTAGTGSGTVNGLPPNPAAVAHGTVVTLNAAPAADSTFAGWSGACTNGSGPCVLTMDGPKAVTATFTRKQFDVNVPAAVEGGRILVEVVEPGAGAGAASFPVAVAPAEADDAAALYPFGTVLKLTAVPDAGYAFRQWDGLPSGVDKTQNPVQVTVTGPLIITASFTVNPIYLPLVDG